MKLSILVAALVCSSALAAVPGKILPNEDSVVKALRKHPDQRLVDLRKEGKSGIKKLRTLAFDTNQVVEVRWRALTTLSRIAKKEALPDLERAVQSKDWFMRDAGIRALEQVDTALAKKWARFLLNDPALVVRTSAVGVIRNLKDKEAAPLLWQKLNSPQNFRGAQSLWVRKHIVEALSEFSTKEDASKFKDILKDKDARLHKPALAALKRFGV